MASSWDTSKPIDHTLVSALPEEVRNLKDLLKSRVIFQATEPSTRPSGAAFEANDNGSIWIDSSDDNKMYILTDYSVPTWTLIYTEIAAQMVAAAHTWASLQTFDKGIAGGADADITLNTDKFTVDATNGNTTIAGTLNIQGTTAVTGVLDEDDMNSNSDTELATQQSIKKYVDDLFQVDGVAGASFDSGSESITFPNGLIIKQGKKAYTGISTTVTFETAFPSQIINVQLCLTHESDEFVVSEAFCVDDVSTSSFKFYVNNYQNAGEAYWIAIGY